MSDRTFTMTLDPRPSKSQVCLDGEDITTLLRGVSVTYGVDHTPTIELKVAPRHRVELVAKCPEAQIVIRPESGLICRVCGGSGELVPRNPNATKWEKCSHCGGEGRVG